MGGNLYYAGEARVSLLRQKGVVYQLQVGGAPDKRDGSASQQADEHIGSPAKRQRGVECVTSPHGATISISLGGGIAMCNFVLATRSTNACVDQALCSSCN